MQIFLHIGSEKTGTTSIQTWCASNRSALMNRGILYSEELGKNNHVYLTCYISQSQRTEDLRRTQGIFDPSAFSNFASQLPQRFATEISKFGGTRMLISNEHLSSRLRDPVEIFALKNFLNSVSGPNTIYKIIVYIRRQDDLIPSMYSTTIKSGGTRIFQFPTTKHWQLNPIPMLDLWSTVFGKENIIVRVFDREAMRNGDVIQDIASLIGLDISAEENDFRSVPDKNVRLLRDSLEFLRLFNAHVPRLGPNGLNQERFGLLEALASMPDQVDYPLASRAEFDAFMRSFTEVNAEIARRYLGREDGQLFAAKPSGKDGPAWPGLTPEMAVRIASHLWVTQARAGRRAGQHAQRPSEDRRPRQDRAAGGEAEVLTG